LLSFAGLSDLLAPVFEEVAGSLAAPRRRALEVALLLAEPGERASDPWLLGLALLDVLRFLAERGPVLVALDDLQWLDPSSAAVVQIGLRRLTSEPVGVLVTLRRAEGVAAAFELERAFSEERLVQLSLPPLSLAALHRLLRERLGLELTRPELVRVREETAGNPFFALELGRELVRTGGRPAPGQALHVPESLRELLGDRLARLPAETVDVLLQVAALARPTVELVAAVHGHRERVLQALETAAREGVVEIDGSTLRFAHPLLASICYEQAPVWKRRAVHEALAEAVSDREEQARHLALAAKGPDAAVASQLDAAAEHAVARGSPTAAAELCELAAELTSQDPSLARQRCLWAATYHRLAGNGERAVEVLERLRTEVASGVERADILFELALAERDHLTIVELCGEALADAVGDDARAARILGHRATSLILVAGKADAGLSDGRAALERAERVGDPALLAMAIARFATAESYAAEITPGLLERGAEIEERFRLALEYHDSPRYILSRQLLRLGETERARTGLEQLETEAAARGDESSRAQALWPLSLLEWQAGRWQQALDHAMAAYELAEQTQYTHARAWVGRAKVLIEADLGLVEQARASAAEALAFALETSNEVYRVHSLAGLGRIELELGDVAAAGGYLRELPAQLLDAGITDPSHAVWADAIETLIALGELEQGRAYLEPYERHSERLGSPWALAAASRCRGLLAAAEGDATAAFAALERSLVEAEAFPLERARTLLALGTVRRQAQQRRGAREALEQALAVFEDLGARLWAEKARGELSRISGRAPASEELTETERRVAKLAARGRSNKEIAAELFMGVSTVEAHLSRVYRKLGVRRAELAARLAEPVESVAEGVTRP
jgi:DNA-binding CsgD family transcriptional regulator